MMAPITAQPSTAPSTKGKPWTATAASEVSERYCAVSTASTTTSTRVAPAIPHAILASISAPRAGRLDVAGHRGQLEPDPGARPGNGADRERAADGLDPVPHVGQAAAGVGGRRVEPGAVVLDRADEGAAAALEHHPDGARARMLGGVLHGLEAREVGRGLDRAVVACVVPGDDLDRRGAGGGRRAEGGLRARVREQGRVDAAGELGECVDGRDRRPVL